MSHFAQVENGVVTQVVVIANADTASADGKLYTWDKSTISWVAT